MFRRVGIAFAQGGAKVQRPMTPLGTARLGAALFLKKRLAPLLLDELVPLKDSMRNAVTPKALLTLPFILLVCGLVPVPARGDIIFQASGSNAYGPTSAQANFVLGNGSITITLTNLVANELSIGQAISQFTFQVNRLRRVAAT